MPNFAANLTMLFNEVEFVDRFQAAAEAGFSAVEYLFPYEYEKERLVEELGRHGLRQVLHNLPAGDWAGGERGIACHPDRVGEFQEGVGRAVEYATALGCPQVNCLAGVPPEGVEADLLIETLLANLGFAAAELESAGIRLLIEPINTLDIPGFFVNSTEQSIAIIEQVGSENLSLQYDIYHMQIMEGDLARTIESNIEIIRHVQIADNPGRHEPGTGEINYRFIFDRLDDLAYSGWIGCEYVPAASTTEGLAWIEPYMPSAGG